MEHNQRYRYHDDSEQSYRADISTQAIENVTILLKEMLASFIDLYKKAF